MGLIKPSEGSVVFEGRQIAAWRRITWPPRHRVGARGPPDFRLLTVMENCARGSSGGRVTDAKRKEMLDKVYARSGVGGAGGQPAGRSGGEQRCWQSSRAMMLEPKIILLDEPTEG